MYKEIDQSGSLAKTEPQDPTSIYDIRFSTQSYINQYANNCWKLAMMVALAIRFL